MSFDPCPLLPPLKFSIVRIGYGVNNGQTGLRTYYLSHCFDDKQKNTLNNGGNNKHKLNTLCVKRP